VPAAAVIPSLIAFSYVVAVKKLVAVISLKRVTLRKSECSLQGNRCTAQQRMTCLPGLRPAGRTIWRRGTGSIWWGQVK